MYIVMTVIAAVVQIAMVTWALSWAYREYVKVRFPEITPIKFGAGVVMAISTVFTVGLWYVTS